MQPLIEIEQGVVRMPEWRMAQPVDFVLAEGENIAIVGDNGSGKSMFVDIITGCHPLLGDQPRYNFGTGAGHYVSDNIKLITFADSYGENNDSTYYLQQRWNQCEIDKETPTVAQALENACPQSGRDATWQDRLYKMFDIERLLDKYIILLSSGELRKLQMAKALLSRPRVLIIDNPFIGLDAEAREQLRGLLAQLCAERALQIILVLSQRGDIPDFISHVVEVKGMTVGKKMPREEFCASQDAVLANCFGEVREKVASLPADTGNRPLPDEIVNMKGVSIKYGDRTILDRLDWTVRNGEKWTVTGRNGSGKSTLMSLVCADNPQSYACDISLFGKRRGSGESIWEIKRHIGYVSPEMHRAYKKNIPAAYIVASGLKETVGLYARPSAEELAKCKWWMDVFGLEGKEETPFLKLSSGEQRLVLLARAFVKDPDLLILDEPLHGLDDTNRQRVKAIMEAFCSRKDKTLVMISHFQEEFPACIDHSLTLKRKI